MVAKGNLIVTTSWDDGTITDLRLAELLDKHGIQGTFYVSRTPKHNLLQPGDISTIDKKFEIGAHTINHPDLTEATSPQVESEIKDSKTYLEDLLGHPVPMFCYPYGRYNDDLKEMVKSHGFIGARTCDPCGLSLPRDPYQWHITLFASNGSPLMALKIWWRFHLWQISALLDWETRAKLLFDLALQKGGVYHIYGHSAELEANGEWDRLERVLNYMSKREGVQYLTNGKILQLYANEVAG